MLFIHDHTFVIDQGKHYTTGSLNQRVMGRYKEWFGDVTVFATKRIAEEKDGAFIREENYVDNVDFQLVNKSYGLSSLWENSKKIEAAVKSADCVVIRMSVFGAIAAYYSKKYKIPYLIEMVACPWDSLWYHSLKGKIVAPFMTLLTKKICKKAPWVLYVTNEFLQRRYPSKGNCIGCSDVELTDISEEILDQRIRKIQSMKDCHKIKAATLANINVRYKGQELVIRSVNELKKAGIELDYYLIGGGDPTYLTNVIQECGVENNVHIIGPKPHDEVFSIIDRMDLYIQPSLQEGLPRAVIEALSRACPVIGSTTGGIPELINPDCVFRKGNQVEFVSLMKTITKEKLLRRANENFEKSRNYKKEYLDKKRKDFYMSFKQSIK